ncbi:MAG: TonB-dependent receptor plug domain-containing protein, partial [Longimicrobiales bacterium]
IDGGAGGDRLHDLNPEDIERVEIIKGPAAATLYGTEASNGVIQVITKRGRSGRPVFNMVMQQGANYLPNPEKLFGNTYFRNTAGQIEAFNVLRWGRETGFAASEYGGNCPDPYRLAGDRCKGEVFSTGAPRSFAGSVSGGSEDVRYYFSADWGRDEGPVVYNWENKLTGRGNMSWTPSEKVTVDFGVAGIRSKLRTASPQQPITTSIIWSQPSARDGPFHGFIGYVPERYHDDIAGFQDLDRTTYNATVNHRPFGWLSHRLVLGGDFTNTRNSELYKRINIGVGSTQPLGFKSVQNARTAFVSTDYAATITFDPIPNLRSATSGGLQYYQRQNDWLFGQGSIFPLSQLETVT